VEELKISKKFFPVFARVLKSYVQGLCDVQEHDDATATATTAIVNVDVDVPQNDSLSTMQ